MTTDEWTRTTDGTEYHAILEQVSPGVYHVTVELMEQMLTELGWVKA